MPFITRKSLFTLVILTAIALLLIAGFVWSGIYNYNAMCTGCHLTPGADETELSKGLYPKPPNLTKDLVDPAHAFWVIKHGIKASGMPAWGKSMNDEYIWNMAAFLQELPTLNAEQYKALVASSGGHSLGGGETSGHSHADGMKDGHEEEASDHHKEGGANDHGGTEGKPAAHTHEAKPAAEGTTHVHADGKKHVHAASKTSAAASTPAAAPVKPVIADEPVTTPAAPEPTTDAPAEHEHHH